MKKSVNNKTVLALLAVLTSASVARAEGGLFTVQNPTPRQQEIAKALVEQGIIVNFAEYPEWYQINYGRLATTMSSPDTQSVHATIKNLKHVVGDQVNVKEIDLMMAKYGSQAFGSQ